MKFNTKALAQLTLSLTLLAGIVVVSTTTTFAQEKEEKTSTKHAKKACGGQSNGVAKSSGKSRG